MILELLTRRRPAATISALYGTIVAQARSPIFYTDYAVPDTVNGRFDMILLHLALLTDRTEATGGPLRALGQQLFDRFCLEMDDYLRESGVGDLTVPKQMRKLAEAFYGRRAVYREALAEDDNRKLEAALIRNVYAGAAAHEAHAMHLAEYVRIAVKTLAGQENIGNGALAWPQPAAVSARAAETSGTIK